MKPIYLDYNASAPAREAALETLRRVAREAAGNAESPHRFGRGARRELDAAREVVAAAIGARTREIVFTSGGTESDNLAVVGVAKRRSSGHVVTSAIEHPAVLEACRHLEKHGFRVTRVPVDTGGRVAIERVADAIAADTILVSIMWVNNETGVIQPVEEIAALARERGVLSHTDAVQAFGRLDIDVGNVPVDLLSISGHKFGAPTGIGALYIRDGVEMESIVHGGGQERGMRSGSPAVALAAALAAAARAAVGECAAETVRLGRLRDRIERELLARIPGAAVNGAGSARVANTTSIRFPGADGEAVLLALDAAGIAVSSASACAAARRATSHVLTAMGLTPREADDSLRVSLGYRTTDADVDRFIRVLPDEVARIRAVSRPTPAL